MYDPHAIRMRPLSGMYDNKAYREIDIKPCVLGIAVGEIDTCCCAERQECDKWP